MELVILPIIVPLASEDVLESVLVHICVYTIDEIVRGHHSPRVCFADGNLKRTQVQFSKRTFLYK